MAVLLIIWRKWKTLPLTFVTTNHVQFATPPIKKKNSSPSLFQVFQKAPFFISSFFAIKQYGEASN
jgi:hypothetical protein